MTVAVVLRTLKNVYENSNFYKEARIVSFVDRLLELMLSKIRKQCGLSAALRQGVQSSHTEMLTNLDLARHCCSKFMQNLFISEFGQDTSPD